MRINAALVLAAALTFGSLAPRVAMADSQGLGASFSDISSAYPTGTIEAQTSGKKTLRLTNIDYAGMKWSTVDFVFDVSGHLEAVALNTQTESFAKVQKMVLAQMQSTTAGVFPAVDAKADEFQIRLCESSETGVTVTFERESFAV